MKYILIILTSFILLTGCGSEDAESSSGALASGQLFNGTVSGVAFECASGISGSVDASGQYSCPETDENVTFSIGGELLGTVPTEAVITPQMLADHNETMMVLLTRKLLGADSDNNSSNGVTVDAEAFGTALATEAEAIAYLEKYFGFVPDQGDTGDTASSVSSESSSAAETGGEASSGSSSSTMAYVSVPPPPPGTEPITQVVPKETGTTSGATPGQTLQRTAVAVTETIPRDWYVRLLADVPATGLSTANAQLGQLDEADALASKSLKAFSPFGGAYIDIVFVDPAGQLTGDYKSVYYPYSPSPQSWRFTVRSSDPNADVVVSWQGLYVLTPYTDNYGRTLYREQLSKTNPLLSRMQVVDEESGDVLPILSNGQMTAFTVNMGGSATRTFRWELLTEASHAVTPASARMQKAARAFLRANAAPEKSTFDLSRPPEFVER